MTAEIKEMREKKENRKLISKEFQFVELKQLYGQTDCWFNVDYRESYKLLLEKINNKI